MMLRRMLSVPAVACVAWLYGSGCGGAPAPVSDQTDAIAAVRSARELGAEGTPQASYHLALADEQLGEGERLIAQGRMTAAQHALQRAKADAELAMALQH